VAKLTTNVGIKVCIDVLNGMSYFPAYTYLHQRGQELFARILMIEDEEIKSALAEKLIT